VAIDACLQSSGFYKTSPALNTKKSHIATIQF